MSENISSGESQLTPEEKKRYALEGNIRELARRKEAGEVDPIDYDINYINYLQESDQPLTQTEVGNKAVVISQQELEQLGYLEMVLPSGETMIIDANDTGYSPDDLLIVFPEDLGNLKPDE